MKKIDWTKLALIALRANRVPLVWGGPGIGKTKRIETEIHRQLCPDKPFVAVAPSLSDPTDATGMLAVVQDRVVRLLPEALKPLIDSRGGLLFIDELTTATQATQAAYLKVTQDRWVGDTKLPDDVRIIIAANPADIAAGGAELVVPMANRVVHINAEAPEPEGWAAWLTTELTRDAQDRFVAAAFGSYIEKSGSGALYAFPEDEGERAKAWPSPRTWHAAAAVYAEALRSGEPAAGFTLVAGCVGVGAAKEVISYIENLDLPDADAVLTGTVKWTPEAARADKASVMLALLCRRAFELAADRDPARTKAQRESIVQTAWEAVKAACEVGLADIAYRHVGPLSNWRIQLSGEMLARFPAEQEVEVKYGFAIRAAGRQTKAA